jgi:ubiquinone/menaquinone biosynthesis C-methylase UbiE
MAEKNAYILGTDLQELHRLGIQHQVWASEAHTGWKLAKFNAGQTLLDLGSGPGFCAKELAYLTGSSGKVIAIDKSPSYINHIQKIATLEELNIEAICSDFSEMELAPKGLDGMYCRWALAWVPKPKEVLAKVYDALKPGGKIVIHEYYDWSTHQTEPPLSNLSKAIKTAYESLENSEGELNIGRYLPSILNGMGMTVTGYRLMSKLATPISFDWQWPKSFYESYFPRLAEIGLLTEKEVKSALKDLLQLENTNGSSICCPLMLEIIAEKK